MPDAFHSHSLRTGRNTFHPQLVHVVVQTSRNLQPPFILIAYAWCLNPTSIHVSCSTRGRLLWHMHDSLTFFIWRSDPIPFKNKLFLIHSYVQVKYVMLNLMKFWQHFALVSKYTKWKRSPKLTTIKYALGEQSNTQ